MALWSFFTSAILITLLVLLRRAEIKRGERYFPVFRKKLDNGAVAISSYFTGTLPRQLVKIVQYVIIHATDLFSSALLRVVRWLEQKLHRLVHAVRGRKEVQRREPTNGYLKDVREHKEEVSKTIEELENENH